MADQLAARLVKRFKRGGRLVPDRGFYLKIALLLVGLLAFNLILSWILQFYFSEPALNIVPLTAGDSSWIPAGTHFAPALGDHYFGDYEVYAAYARSTSSAYYPQVTGFFLPAAYGPFTIVFTKAFDVVFGWPIEVFVYLLISLFLFAYGIFRVLGPSVEALLLTCLLMLSAPVIQSLDRGNFTLLVAGLSVVFCRGVLEKRAGLTIVSLTLACAFKPYAAVLLIVLIRNRRWRELLVIVGATVAVTTVSFLTLPGSFIQNIHGFVQADISFNRANSLIGDSASIAALIFKFILLSSGATNANHFLGVALLTYLPGIAICVLCIAIIWLYKGLVEIQLVAALAIMQLAPIDADANLQVNIVIGLCLLLRMLSRSRTQSADVGAEVGRQICSRGLPRIYQAIAIVLLGIGATPWLFRFGTSPSINTEAWLIFGPILTVMVLVVLLLGLVMSRSDRHQMQPVRKD